MPLRSHADGRDSAGIAAALSPGATAPSSALLRSTSTGRRAGRAATHPAGAAARPPAGLRTRPATGSGAPRAAPRLRCSSAAPAVPPPLTAPPAPGTPGDTCCPARAGKGSQGGLTLQVRTTASAASKKPPLPCSLPHKGRQSMLLPRPSSLLPGGVLGDWGHPRYPLRTLATTQLFCFSLQRLTAPLCDPPRDDHLPWMVVTSGTIPSDSRGTGGRRPSTRSQGASHPREKPALAAAGRQLPRRGRGHGASAPREPGRRWSCRGRPAGGQAQTFLLQILAGPVAVGLCATPPRSFQRQSN